MKKKKDFQDFRCTSTQLNLCPRFWALEQRKGPGFTHLAERVFRNGGGVGVQRQDTAINNLALQETEPYKQDDINCLYRTQVPTLSVLKQEVITMGQGEFKDHCSLRPALVRLNFHQNSRGRPYESQKKTCSSTNLRCI